ncbi:toxin-antitoxin system YwqK family antitoxin [Reichenbachiella versicolor]|uniref:toxin-antitoxin system YwqK family antitoxin n=1 Tax=Reichenbachiella versicolor TaxID=1821036 RepID=UPI0013A5B041|nr:toxin-antitoxin system YwqK family antitoxin [Reichenbachiella versicolor]
MRKNFSLSSKKILVLILFFSLFSCSHEYERVYFESGNLMFEVPVQEGKRNGELSQYYENGQIQLKSHWSKGVKHGEIISYYENGVVKAKENSVNGVAQGIFTYFDSLGNLKETITFENGKENGDYFKYYPDSSLNVRASFEEGKRSGKVWVYYPDGTISGTRIYNSGELVYSADYTKDGGLFKPYMNIEFDDNHIIRLTDSFYEDSAIGVILGALDERMRLKDTLDVLGSSIGNHQVSVDNSQIVSKISGVLYEIVLEDGRQSIKNEYAFEFSID